MKELWMLPSVPVLIALNAFFVVAEYAVVASTPADVVTLIARKRSSAANALERLRGRPAAAIGTIQVCITMSNLLLGWFGEPAMSALLDRIFGPVIAFAPTVLEVIATIASFFIVTLLTVVFSELLPKALTLRHVVTAVSLTAVPVAAISAAISPLVWLMNRMANAVTLPLGLGSVEQIEQNEITPEQLRLLTIQATEHGQLSKREQSLVLNSLAIGRKHAREIMVPRVRVAYLDLRTSMEENRRVMESHLYSRLPLCDGGMDHVVGVVPLKEFLIAYHGAGDPNVLRLIARTAVFLPGTLSLDRLLEALVERHTQFAFLVDEYGGVQGIVTLRDVVDELLAPETSCRV